MWNKGIFRILFCVLLKSYVEIILEATISRVFPYPAIGPLIGSVFLRPIAFLSFFSGGSGYTEARQESGFRLFCAAKLIWWEKLRSLEFLLVRYWHVWFTLFTHFYPLLADHRLRKVVKRQTLTLKRPTLLILDTYIFIWFNHIF